MKRFRWIPALISVVLLAACTPSFGNDTELVQETDEAAVETTIIPNLSLGDNYYKTLVPYKESKIRGLVVSNLNSKYDVKEVDNGLMRLSQNKFSTNNYLFQEGQYLDRETVENWLARPNQTENEAIDQQGLNPSSVDKEGNDLAPEVRAKKAPVYLAHIVEQNYLVKTKENKVALGGISIGLAMNSIYYYQKEAFGEWYEETIPDEKIKSEGQKIAQEIVERIRAREDIPNVPIVVGLFKQNAKNTIVPGTYFYYGEVNKDASEVKDWKKVNEQYVTFPMSSPEEQYRELNDKFAKFKQDVDEYFANFTSIIGTGFYQNNSAQSLQIEIPIQFFGTSEIIGFAQYLTSSLLQEFPQDLPVTVSITSINGPEALIKKEKGNPEPIVHIYE